MSKDKDGNWFKRHKILTVVLAIIVIAVIASASGGDKTNTNSSNNDVNNSQPAKTENKQTTAKIGESARDGRFEFTVASMKCGETTVGDQYLTKQAQGQFCLVDMTVKNIGNEAQLFDSPASICSMRAVLSTPLMDRHQYTPILRAVRS